MANMVSMNIAPEYNDGPYEPDYCPCVYLTEEQCDALGIDKALDAGTVIGMTIRGVVTRSTSSVDSEDDADDPDVSMCVQITDAMIVAPPEATDNKKAAKALYGGATTADNNTD